MVFQLRLTGALPLMCAALTLSALARAESSNADEDALASVYGDAGTVSIATGVKQDLRRAPSTATVITAQDIAAMGATDLAQVLESVPGLHVSVYNQAQFPVYSFRGIQRGFNSQVLLLINGTPINNAFTGNRGQASGAFPLENVQRIEVIRGPGSAVYGADAYSGVINVITKTSADLAGLTGGVRLGTFNSADTWLQYGGDSGALRTAWYLGLSRTDGPDGVIQKDLAATLDDAFGTHTSFAPGSLYLRQDGINASLDAAYQDWRLRAGYQWRNLGFGSGIAESLDPRSRIPTSRFMVDLWYQKTDWAKDWDLAFNLEYQDFHQDFSSPNPYIFPPGALGGLFPQGAIGNPSNKERHTGAHMTLGYNGWQSHKLRLGLGTRTEDIYETGETKNFTVSLVPGVGSVISPLPAGLVTVNGDNPAVVYLVPMSRRVNYWFAQDEWRFANDWTMTLGLRTDSYSDFGSTTNPRVGLVWDARQDLVVKLLHGEAFRAPSFVEEYPGVNPTNVGNPNLKPETIATDELVFAWQPQPKLQTNLTFFQNRERDIIQVVKSPSNDGSATEQNGSGQTGRGFELELIWDALRDWRLSGSFSMQRATLDATGEDAGLAPKRRLFMRSDWHLAPQWQLGTVLNYVADRAREPGDTRPPIADYTTVDLSLKREKLWGNWEFRAGVQNVFNRDAREPSFKPGNIYYDLPVAQRAVWVQLQRNL